MRSHDSFFLKQIYNFSKFEFRNETSYGCSAPQNLSNVHPILRYMARKYYGGNKSSVCMYRLFDRLSGNCEVG